MTDRTLAATSAYGTPFAFTSAARRCVDALPALLGS